MFKRLIFVLAWYMFVNGSEPTDKWVVYFEDENTIHKCKREDYLEMKEMLETDTENDVKNYYRMRYEESLTYTELHRNKSIN